MLREEKRTWMVVLVTDGVVRPHRVSTFLYVVLDELVYYP
jgi:hypothetical protein